jgi:hypothetical protein
MRSCSSSSMLIQQFANPHHAKQGVQLHCAQQQHRLTKGAWRYNSCTCTPTTAHAQVGARLTPCSFLKLAANVSGIHAAKMSRQQAACSPA